MITLVNGFESYCKKRFLEIENEGKKPDSLQLIKTFTTKSEKDNDIKNKIIEESKLKKISILEFIIINKRIDFQNFKKCNTAFKKGYNISFYNDLALEADNLDLIKKVIHYRHKLVHHSMTESNFNLNKVISEPIFTNLELGKKCIKIFSKFINQLHKKTS